MAWNFQQFGQTPNVIGNPCFHRRSHAQAAVNTAEIVMGKIQRHSGFQIFQFSGESNREPCKPAKLGSHSEVLPFHKASRDVTRVRVSASDLGYNLRDSWWGVPLIAELAVVPKQFGELREISIAAKRFFNSFPVEDVSIGSELNPMVVDSA